jgi:hypothetical protein
MPARRQPCPLPGDDRERFGKCFRNRRQVCQGVNPWVEFLSFHGGKGHKRDELSRMYKEAKQARRALIGAPYNVRMPRPQPEGQLPAEVREKVCTYTRARQALGAEQAREDVHNNFSNGRSVSASGSAGGSAGSEVREVREVTTAPTSIEELRRRLRRIADEAKDLAKEPRRIGWTRDDMTLLGTIGDGNCLLHTLMTPLGIIDDRQSLADPREAGEVAKKLRKEILGYFAHLRGSNRALFDTLLDRMNIIDNYVANARNAGNTAREQQYIDLVLRPSADDQDNLQRTRGPAEVDFDANRTNPTSYISAGLAMLMVAAAGYAPNLFVYRNPRLRRDETFSSDLPILEVIQGELARLVSQPFGAPRARAHILLYGDDADMMHFASLKPGGGSGSAARPPATPAMPPPRPRNSSPAASQQQEEQGAAAPPPQGLTTVGDGVTVKYSDIPNAGYGLFANRAFRTGEFITLVEGRRVLADVDARKASLVEARRFISRGDGFVVDGFRNPRAARGKGGGAFANDCRGSGKPCNAKVLRRRDPDAPTMNILVLQATRPIAKGDEILISYGAKWWAKYHPKM